MIELKDICNKVCAETAEDQKEGCRECSVCQFVFAELKGEIDKRDELISLLPEIINSLKNHCHPDNKVYTKFNQLLEGLKV